MSNLIFVVVLLIVGLVLLATRKGQNRLIGFVPLALAAVLLATSLVKVVAANEVGVPVTFGRVGNPLQSGVRVVAPWTTVETFSIRLQVADMSQSADEGDQARADGIAVTSKEGGQLTLDVTVQYIIDAQRADDLYRRVGPSMDRVRDEIVRPDTRSILRDVYTLYTAEEAYTSKRAVASTAAEEKLREVLARKFITLDDLLIRNIVVSTDLQTQIDRKLQALQEVERVRIESQKLQTEAETRRKVAEFDAASRVVAAKGEAEANRVLSESLTPEVLRAREIDAIQGNGNTVFFPYGQPITPLVQTTPGAARSTATTAPSTTAPPATVASG